MGLKKLLFEHISKLGFKKSPDIEQKKDPRRKQPRFPNAWGFHGLTSVPVPSELRKYGCVMPYAGLAFGSGAGLGLRFSS